MRLLATPSSSKYSFVLIDVSDGSVKKTPSDPREKDLGASNSRPPHRPFGLTWDSDWIYVANRRNLCVYNERLSFVDKVERVFDDNTHQLTVSGDYLIAAMTSMDAVCFYQKSNGKCFYFSLRVFDFVKYLPSVKKERHHVNNVVAHRDFVYVNLHNRGIGKSQVLVLDMKSMKMTDVISHDAVCSHGLSIEPGDYGTVDTGGTQDLVSRDNRVAFCPNPKSFCRGLAGSGGDFFACHFRPAVRRFRGIGDSTVEIIRDWVWQSASSIILDGVGAINDIRLIDAPDSCHHNPAEAPLCF